PCEPPQQLVQLGVAARIPVPERELQPLAAHTRQPLDRIAAGLRQRGQLVSVAAGAERYVSELLQPGQATAELLARQRKPACQLRDGPGPGLVEAAQQPAADRRQVDR